MSWYSRPLYPYRARRRPAAGLRLRKGRGEVSDTWWGKRWLEALESFGWHTRLTRGRDYARSGQVVSVKVEAGAATALVQGSQAKPYKVRIALHAYSRKDWARVAGVLAGKALFAAKLLAGEMPQGIEEAFRGAQRPLFPKSKRDLSTDCSCPDWENPCKHIAAAYFILAQEFDRDPFLLLKLRGLDRAGFLAELRARRGSAAPADPDDWGPGLEERPAAPAPKRPSAGADLSGRLEGFYRPAKALPAPSAEPARPARAGALVRELGVPPFWRGRRDFQAELARVYEAMSERAPSARKA